MCGAYLSVEFKNFLVKLVPQASILFNLLFDGGLCGFHGFHHLKQAVVVVGSGGGAGAGGDGQACEFLSQSSVIVPILHLLLLGLSDRLIKDDPKPNQTKPINNQLIALEYDWMER